MSIPGNSGNINRNRRRQHPDRPAPWLRRAPAELPVYSPTDPEERARIRAKKRAPVKTWKEVQARELPTPPQRAGSGRSRREGWKTLADELTRENRTP